MHENKPKESFENEKLYKSLEICFSYHIKSENDNIIINHFGKLQNNKIIWKMKDLTLVGVKQQSFRHKPFPKLFILHWQLWTL